MIDLDKAQDEAASEKAWDAVFRVGGEIVVMLPPSRARETDERKGLVPALGAGIARVWRLVFGGSEIAALRRQVLDGVDPSAPESARAVHRLGMHHLGLLAIAWTKQASAYNDRVAALALAARAGVTAPQRASEAALKPASKGVDGPKGVPVPAGMVRGPDVPLRARERLPWFLGGGRWGSDLAKHVNANSTSNGTETQTNG